MIEQDVILNKKVSIERCVKQIRLYYSDTQDFSSDYLRQDAIVVNIQRIADLSIDIANYVLKKRKLGLPKSSSESFSLLSEAGIITQDMLLLLKGMVGFRNIIVHQYTQLDIDLMVEVIENHLEMPIEFAQIILKKVIASQ